MIKFYSPFSSFSRLIFQFSPIINDVFYKNLQENRLFVEKAGFQ